MWEITTEIRVVKLSIADGTACNFTKKAALLPPSSLIEPLLRRIVGEGVFSPTILSSKHRRRRGLLRYKRFSAL